MTHLYILVALILLINLIDVLPIAMNNASYIFHADKNMKRLLPTAFAFILFFIGEAVYWLFILIKLIYSML
jgi:hypothetical protein